MITWKKTQFSLNLTLVSKKKQFPSFCVRIKWRSIYFLNWNYKNPQLFRHRLSIAFLVFCFQSDIIKNASIRQYSIINNNVCWFGLTIENANNRSARLECVSAWHAIFSQNCQITMMTALNIHITFLLLVRVLPD